MTKEELVNLLIELKKITSAEVINQLAYARTTGANPGYWIDDYENGFDATIRQVLDKLQEGELQKLFEGNAYIRQRTFRRLSRANTVTWPMKICGTPVLRLPESV
jgi:hypothetical protein